MTNYTTANKKATDAVAFYPLENLSGSLPDHPAQLLRSLRIERFQGVVLSGSCLLVVDRKIGQSQIKSRRRQSSDVV